MHGQTNGFCFEYAALALVVTSVVALYGMVLSERFTSRAPIVAITPPALPEAPHPTGVSEGKPAVHAALSGALSDRASYRLRETDSVLDIRAEIECLATTIYFESRGESDAGKLAVGHVVINRVSDLRFPSRICNVVRQGGERPRFRCQFSWWCDGRSDTPRDLRAWQSSVAFARRVFWGLSEDPTQGALWYHAEYVKPSWRVALSPGRKIGRHVFYGEGL